MFQDRFSALASTAVLLAVLVLTPTTVAAQAGGCPWCVTPTACALVPEGTSLEGCAVAQEHGCMPVPGERCEIQVAMADPAALSNLLGEYGITFNGVRTASVLGLEFPVVAVNDGLHLRWGCGGQVLAAFVRDPDGQWTEVDASPHTQRFSLRRSSNEDPGLQ